MNQPSRLAMALLSTLLSYPLTARGQALLERSIPPSTTDPRIRAFDQPHGVVLDPAAAPRGELLVFLVGTGGVPSGDRLVVQQAARSGYHAVSLMYPNDVTIDSLCASSPDAGCFEAVRREILDGLDRSLLVSVDPPNSVEGRLVKLLAYLDSSFPAEGWGLFLEGGAPRWPLIAAAGHSQGGGHAALLAKLHPLSRTVLLAAPQDTSTVTGRPAPWLSSPSATPPERLFSFMHVADPGAGKQRTARAALGLGTTANVDGAAPPFGPGTPHQLETAAVPASSGSQAAHGCVAVDGSTPKAADGTPLFAPIWNYLFTAGPAAPSATNPFRISYRAGTRDASNAFMGGTELRLLAAHEGRLYAGTETWKDAPAGTGDPEIGAQILALDAPEGPWRLDHHFDERIPGGQGRQDIRHEGVTALESVTFTTDASGRPLATPETILLAACRDFTGKASVYTRDDATGSWIETVLAEPVGADKATIRSIGLYRDRVTGVDLVFAGTLPTGIRSGAYDASLPGRIRWNPEPELSDYLMRPMAFAICNGALHVAIAPDIWRRIDGPNPRWEKVFTYPTELGFVPTTGGSSGLSGLSAIPNPGGSGESLLAALEGSPSLMVRLDPRPDLPYSHHVELDVLATLGNLWGTRGKYGVIANSEMTWASDPATGEQVLIVTVQHHPAKARDDAWYFVRRQRGATVTYETKRIDNTTLSSPFVLNSTRAAIVSPFIADGERYLYFGGYDADDNPSHNTAYVLRVPSDEALSAGSSSGAPETTWLLPSSARAPGAGGAFYTTDLTVSNVGIVDTSFALKFLGHDTDGRSGPEKSFSLAAGRSVTYSDLLGSVFGLASDYGAVRLSSSSAAIVATSQTSTPAPSGGTFGQSVPPSSEFELIHARDARSILAVREDGAFRTNLVLANASEAPLDVDVALVADTGATLATKRFALPALGMTQVTRVVRDLGLTTDVSGARLVLSTPTGGGAFAAYAALIDNQTNDPRTLLPSW